MSRGAGGFVIKPMDGIEPEKNLNFAQRKWASAISSLGK
jgi:hypothetical protein